MLGENTLLFTRKGFKKLKYLNKYDEVLTGYGDFAHITELGPLEKMTKCVEFSTGERIYCDDNVLWNIGCQRTYKFTDELEICGDNSACTEIFEITGVRGRNKSGSYEKSVIIPRYVPDEYILCDKETRLEFLAGLIDSPMCEIGSSEGIYVFYTHDAQFAHGLISLARSLGFGVVYKYKNLVHIVRVYMHKYVDAIPIKDEYKESWDYASIKPPVKVTKVRDIKYKEACLGRSIKVNGGFLLIGYSFIPVF